MATATESLRLQHPNSIVPTDNLQVWQEQVENSGHHFVRALQSISPPNAQTASNTPTQSGCASMAFDASSVLLATRLEDAPSTIWIWDTTTAELRAVLLFHGNISRFSWHPAIRETLLIVCEGDLYNPLAFLWDPLSGGPKALDFSDRLSDDKLQVHWLNVNGLEPGALLVSDSRKYLLTSLAVEEGEPVPWSSDGDSSTLLSKNSPHSGDAHLDDEYEEEASELDDTFCFKKA
ncbi:WD repeat-containing protein WRAP73 [Cytospora mali]|uniref:WD repeat-containing protein WRAP73 n=1 Tax=Cytospora mali TaxID=578113 RepID=A0A194UXF3_CYTMA|nr:WD repeat-containing protein WRAP73 [Valsa mali var. pyri (nom. inval.)]